MCKFSFFRKTRLLLCPLVCTSILVQIKISVHVMYSKHLHKNFEMDQIIVGEEACTIQDILDVVEKASTYSQLLNNWSTLARQLNIKDSMISKLRKDYTLDKITFEDLFCSLLYMWKAHKGRASKLTELLCAFSKCGLNDISDTVKDALENKLKNQFISSAEINFQGQLTTIRKLISNQKVEKVLSSHVGIELLRNLKNRVSTPLLKDTIGPQLEYYIPRTLSLQTRLNVSIFKERSHDIFIFTGIDWNELSKLANGNLTDKSSTQTREVNVRFILLEFEEDYNQICEIAQHPVHLVESKGPNFYCVKSHGALDLIQKFIHEEQETFQEGQFVSDVLSKFSSKAICIVDTPGMGKTVLLNSLAHQIRVQYPGRVVLFITLRELVEEMDEDELTPSKIFNMVLKHATSNSLGLAVLNYLVGASDLLFELFLDGFDEVLPTQLDSTMELLKYLSKSRQIRIHVTARPHMRTQLENLLKVISFTILPFNEQNQIEFLQKYWIHKFHARGGPHLKEFAGKCLTKLKTSMTDLERDIAGIPLQCSLLAEVYSRDATKYSQGLAKFEFSVQVSSIFEMYKEIMKVKLEKLFSSITSKDKQFLDELKERVMKYHVHGALSLIFPDLTAKLSCMKNLEISEHELYTLGIMERTTTLVSPTSFVHRTFAEYLVAEYLVKGMGKCLHCNRFSQLLLQHVLSDCMEFQDNFLEKYGGPLVTSYRFRYPVIAYFVDAHLRELRLYKFEPVKFHEGINRLHIISACCVTDLPFCFRFIAQTMFSSNSSYVETSKWTELILLAANYSSHDPLEILNPLIQLAQQHQGLRLKDLRFPTFSKCLEQFTPLHVAAHRGSYRLFEYFLHEYGDEIRKIRRLLRICTHQTILSAGGILNEKMNIIKLIIQLRKENDAEEPNLGTWIQPHVHPKLIQCLLEQGVNPNELDDRQNTILHLQFKKFDGKQLLTPEMYGAILTSLSKHGFNLWNHSNSENKTPIIIAVENVEVLPSSLELVQSHGVNFSPGISQGDTVLFAAIRGGRSAEFIRTLFRLGCDPKQKGSLGRGALHYAAEFGNYDVVCELIRNNPDLIFEADKNKMLPLHLAVLKRSPEHELIQEFLLKIIGRRLGRLKKEDNCPIILAFREGSGLSYDILLKMNECSFDVKSRTSYIMRFMITNTNIRSEGRGSDYVKVFRFCVENSGRIVIRDIISQTRNNKEQLGKFLVFNDNLLKSLNEFSPELITPASKPRNPFELVLQDKIKLEHLLLSLLENDMLVPFRIFRNICQTNKKYLTTPPGVVEFMGGHGRIFVVKVLDLQIFSDRILDCLEEVQEFKYSEETDSMESDNVGIYNLVKVDTITVKLLERLEKLESYFIVAGNSIENTLILWQSLDVERYKIHNDHIEWSDLSYKFQKELASVNCTEFKLSQTSRMMLYEILQGNILVDFINTRNFSGDIFYLTQELVNKLSAGQVKVGESISVSINLMSDGLNFVKFNFFDKFKLEYECIVWYFVAVKVLQESETNPEFLKIFFESEEETITPDSSDGHQKIVRRFKYDLLVYLLDCLIKDSDYTPNILNFEADYIPNFLETCVHSNANNFIYLASKQSALHYPSGPLIHWLIHESINFPEHVVLNRIELIKVLVRSNRNLISTKPDNSCNSNLLLMSNIHVEFIKLLIDLNIDMNAVDQSNSFNFLHWASCCLPLEQFTELVSYLVKNGMGGYFFNQRDSEYRTPIHVALQYHKLNSFNISLLTFYTNYFNIVDNDGDNLFLYAAKQNTSAQVLEGLVNNGAHWNTRSSKNKRTALHWASFWGNVDAVNYLLSLGCDVNARDTKDLTPIELAGSEETFEVLKHHSASVNCLNNHRETSIDENIEITEL